MRVIKNNSGEGTGGEVQKCNSAEVSALSKQYAIKELARAGKGCKYRVSKEQKLLHSMLLEIILFPGRHTKLEQARRFIFSTSADLSMKTWLPKYCVFLKICIEFRSALPKADLRFRDWKPYYDINQLYYYLISWFSFNKSFSFVLCLKRWFWWYLCSLLPFL